MLDYRSVIGFDRLFLPIYEVLYIPGGAGFLPSSAGPKDWCLEADLSFWVSPIFRGELFVAGCENIGWNKSETTGFKGLALFTYTPLIFMVNVGKINQTWILWGNVLYIPYPETNSSHLLGKKNTDTRNTKLSLFEQTLFEMHVPNFRYVRFSDGYKFN